MYFRIFVLNFFFFTLFELLLFMFIGVAFLSFFILQILFLPKLGQLWNFGKNEEREKF